MRMQDRTGTVRHRVITLLGPQRQQQIDASGAPRGHQIRQRRHSEECGRGLIEQSAHLAVATQGAVTAVDTGALLVLWTHAHPGRQALGRRNGRRRGADFGGRSYMPRVGWRVRTEGGSSQRGLPERVTRPRVADMGRELD